MHRSLLSASYATSYTYTTFNIPGAVTQAFGINDGGQIVGYFHNPRTHGFLKDGNTYTTLDVLGATNTVASGINNGGQIVGTFVDATGAYGFLKDGNTYTTLDVPGATDTRAFGINNGGQIVGMFGDGTRSYGFLKDGDTYTTLDVPGAYTPRPSGSTMVARSWGGSVWMPGDSPMAF
jgi:probable HAF family extracellular repeat protein